MGDKYILELEDKPLCVFDEDTHTYFPRLHRVNGFNSFVFDQNGLNNLTPYTEPDTSEVYQRGLSDAWEAARTLWNTPNRKEIFGHTTFNTVLTTHTAQEAIEKIRRYEQEQEEEQIQIGDEVILDGRKYVVLVVDEDGIPEKLLEPDGYTLTLTTDVKLPKTGRHFSEIAAVLAKMKEES